MYRYMEGSLPAVDQYAIPYRAWLASVPTATLLLSHGMSEHAGRYQPFARYLAERNINTWTIEHRGHGAHCPPEDRGHFADRDGWQKVVSDLNQFKRRILAETPNLPLILLGHSMGSYLALAAVMAESDGYDGLVLTGSGLNPRGLLRLGVVTAGFEKWRLGGRGRSLLMSAATFQSFNRRFKPNRTAFDWLSRDPEAVDDYIADPLCGFACTTQFWLDLLHGQIDLYELRNRGVFPASLPVQLIGGTDDPVGRYGAGVKKLAELLQAGGVQQVSVHRIDGARHEVLNEVGREATWELVGAWINKIAKARR